MSLHCINRCFRLAADDSREPSPARHGNLCNPCADRLDRWLTEIPERYALADQYLEPSVNRDPDPNNPETSHLKQPQAPPPARVDVLDVLDTRLIRKWLGTDTKPDRRGTLGTLLAIGNEIREGQGAKLKRTSTVISESDHIRANLKWLAAQEWITDAYQEIRTLHRHLGDAIGVYPPKPVGTCYVVPKDSITDEPCGGPLLPTYSGVRCPRCGAEWGYERLRQLGMALEA